MFFFFFHKCLLTLLSRAESVETPQRTPFTRQAARQSGVVLPPVASPPRSRRRGTTAPPSAASRT